MRTEAGAVAGMFRDAAEGVRLLVGLALIRLGGRIAGVPKADDARASSEDETPTRRGACEHGTTGCDGIGEKHACSNWNGDPRDFLAPDPMLSKGPRARAKGR